MEDLVILFITSIFCLSLLALGVRRLLYAGFWEIDVVLMAVIWFCVLLATAIPTTTNNGTSTESTRTHSCPPTREERCPH